MSKRIIDVSEGKWVEKQVAHMPQMQQVQYQGPRIFRQPITPSGAPINTVQVVNTPQNKPFTYQVNQKPVQPPRPPSDFDSDPEMKGISVEGCSSMNDAYEKNGDKITIIVE